ncbi:MAG TPA: CAP domain-containing protein, partial [Chroococcales cyanobacterium]
MGTIVESLIYLNDLAIKGQMRNDPLLSIVTALVCAATPCLAGGSTLLLAARKPAARAKAAPDPRRQIYPAGSHTQHSEHLGAEGIPAYVLSSAGTKRGFLLQSSPSGFAGSIGLSGGDVILSVNSHVVQTARELDNALAQDSPGSETIVFVHPGDAGLQMYTVPVAVPALKAGMATISSSGDVTVRTISPLGRPEVNSNSAAAIPACERYMVELINHDRSANGGVASVSEDGQLSSLARSYAQEMASGGFFAHKAPDGRDPQDRARAAGIRKGVYENIAWRRGADQHMQQLVAGCQKEMMDEPPNEMNHR